MKIILDLFREGERINSEFLAKPFKYEKLTKKILLKKIYYFQQFINNEQYQQLTGQAMREIGLKTTKTPYIMAVLAEYYS